VRTVSAEASLMPFLIILNPRDSSLEAALQTVRLTADTRAALWQVEERRQAKGLPVRTPCDIKPDTI